MTKHLLLSLLLACAASPALPQAATVPKGPQPISRTVYMSRVDSAFGAVDANKDGYTDKSEIEAFEAKALAARKTQLLKQRETAFRQMDKDKNGTLSLAEFNAAAAAQSSKPNAAPQIARLDTNKDGKVSMAESRAPAGAQFDRLDTNKDGILSVEEQAKARRR